MPNTLRIPGLHRLYHWMLRQAESPKATKAMAAISFAESSFFPLPPDLMLIPMMVANRRRIWFYATVCTAASVLGGLAGYLIGALLWEYVGQPILLFYGLADRMETFRAQYEQYGIWIIAVAGFTPIPYKIITIASGAFAYPLLPFLVVSAVSRGARFFLLGGMLYFFGPPIRRFVEKRLELVTTALLVAIVLGFVAAKYLF